jgi:hypothetical protein
MLGFFTLLLLVSLDNVRLATGLALLEPCPRQRQRLAVLTVVAETTMPLLGATLVHGRLAPLAGLAAAGPLLLVIAAALSLAALLRQTPMRPGRYLYALPLLFGFDNLVAGAGTLPGWDPMASALWLGPLSGAVSLAAMLLAGRLGRRLGHRWSAAPVAAALVVGLSFFVV